MITDTAERIVDYIAQHKEVTPHQLREYLGIGAPALYRQLKKLQLQSKITKTGSPPRVFYRLATTDGSSLPEAKLNKDLIELLNKDWLHITSLGKVEEGLDGFAAWCQQFKLPIAKTAAEYQQTRLKYDQFKRGDLINGLPELNNTFAKVYLDELYYLDFYSIERFGKTKLGALLLYAKQSQNKALMARLFTLIKPAVKKLITNKHITAVGFIPPTVQRVTQLQKELEKNLALTLPVIKIVKATSGIAVAQKTLSRLEDRVENAAGSIFIDGTHKAKRILLIDDAVGSGASMNETARKLKANHPQVQVIGLAITGSFKGFDVLNEV